jgi:hypothetical protein
VDAGGDSIGIADDAATGDTTAREEVGVGVPPVATAIAFPFRRPVRLAHHAYKCLVEALGIGITPTPQQKLIHKI